MVALAMAMAPRGLSCGAAAVSECKRLAMVRALAPRMPLLLLESRSRAAASRGFFCLPRSSSTKLSSSLPWNGHRGKSYIRAAAVEEPPELTKKRLSRDERTAVVKSYVNKFMSENNGEFPSLTAVIKETGGSRAVVKDILAEIQTGLKTPSEGPAEGAVKSEEPAANIKPVAGAAAAAGVPESESEEDYETEDESQKEAGPGEAPAAEASPKDEGEKLTSLRRMTGETPGEINTYSDILSRLRSLGSNRSESGSATAEGARGELSEEKTGSETRKPSFAARIMPPRHGMFVRFLPPSATEEDLRTAFGDCGEIVRVAAVKPMKPTAKFTYGFIDFKTADGLSNGLRKNVEICGQKVEMEAAPTQNTQVHDTIAKAKERDGQSPGAGFIDNLVSKVVSMGSPGPENNINQQQQHHQQQAQAPLPPRVWNGQEAGRFNQFNRGGPGLGPGGFQRNEMPPPPGLRNGMPPMRNDIQPLRNEMPPPPPPPLRNEIPPGRSEVPPPPGASTFRNADMPPLRMGMPSQPRNPNMPPRVLPPRTPEGGFAPAIPTLSDPKKMRKEFSVVVEDLPPTTNVSMLKDALAIHGDIYAVYMKSRDANVAAYYFEFMNDEAKESALAAHWVHLNGQMLRVSRVELPRTTVVRVSNVSPNTPDAEFISACKSCGQVERVEARRDRVRDVYFYPSESENMIKILDKLNEITRNQCRWYAKPAPRVTLSMLNKSEGQAFVYQQIKQLLKSQESMLNQLQIEQRDLRELCMYAVEMLSRKP